MWHLEESSMQFNNINNLVNDQISFQEILKSYFRKFSNLISGNSQISFQEILIS